MRTNHSTAVGTDTDDPATLAVAALTKQAEQFGYLVAVWTGDPVFAGPIEVDHEAQTVAINGDADPASVIPALAAIVAAIASN